MVYISPSHEGLIEPPSSSPSWIELPNGNATYSKFVFRETKRMARLVWVHGFADAEGNRIRAPFAEQFPLEMLTSVVFEDENDGTRVEPNWESLTSTLEEETFFASMMASMNGGWSGSFKQLDEFLAAG